jgi:3-deoxy-D-manno-octulosonic-acid transferase
MKLVLYEVFYFCVWFVWSFYILVSSLFKKRNLIHFWKRLFPDAIPTGDEPIIWIHAVSVGEVIAAIPLLKELRKRGRLVISCVTETGIATAKKLTEDVTIVPLPFDFRYSVRRCLKNVQPKMVLLSEGDFWPVFVDEMKKKGACLGLFNGKMSDKTFKRLLKISFFAKWLYAPLDFLCVQSELMKERFTKVGVNSEKIYVTGNTKVDVEIQKSSDESVEAYKKQLHIDETDFVVILGSTHAPEEEILIQKLYPLLEKYSDLKVIVVPRHPERSVDIYKQLAMYKVPCSLFSKCENFWKLLVVDSMGQLIPLYQISHLSIVCGSFVEKIGGHNIFEPAFFQKPIVVGPYMHSQKMLFESAMKGEAVTQVTIDALPSYAEDLITNAALREQRGKAAHAWAESLQGATQKTLQIILDETACRK